MPLTGPQLDTIHKTILTAYDRDAFRRAVKGGMDVDFDAIAPEKGFDTQLWSFLNWANRRNQVPAVVRCAWERNQESAELAALWQEVQGWDRDETTAAARDAADALGSSIGSVCAVNFAVGDRIDTWISVGAR